MEHPQDAKAISSLVSGEWKAIATIRLDSGILVAKDAYKEVLGKTGKIVLAGQSPQLVSFGWENHDCGPATPYGEIESWVVYEIPPPGWVQMAWTYGSDNSDIHTWSGKPLSAAEVRALTPLYAADDSMYPEGGGKWLLLGFKRQCKQDKKPESVLLLEPTRGGMLVQYYVDGYILYERVRPGGTIADCKKAHTASEKTICSDSILKNLDGQLADTYHQAFERTQPKSAQRQALIQAQRTWLQSVSVCQGKLPCLQKAYEQRMQELQRAK